MKKIILFLIIFFILMINTVNSINVEPKYINKPEDCLDEDISFKIDCPIEYGAFPVNNMLFCNISYKIGNRSLCVYNPISIITKYNIVDYSEIDEWKFNPDKTHKLKSNETCEDDDYYFFKANEEFKFEKAIEFNRILNKGDWRYKAILCCQDMSLQSEHKTFEGVSDSRMTEIVLLKKQIETMERQTWIYFIAVLAAALIGSLGGEIIKYFAKKIKKRCEEK